MGIQSGKNPRRHRYRRLLLALWFVVAVTAGAQPALLLPSGLAYDAQGTLYFSDLATNTIQKLSVTGTLSLVAGTGIQGFSGDGGPATQAALDSPGAITLDAAGNLYFADSHNHRIRKVSIATGIITTFAGTGVAGFGQDGLAAKASAMDLPSALAFGADGSLYFSDTRNHVVRRVDPVSATVNTVLGTGTQGSGGDGGQARAAQADSPAGLAFESNGNLYVSDAHNPAIRRIDAVTGVVSSVPIQLTLRQPAGIAVAADGSVYLSDAGSQAVLRMNPQTGQAVSIAGTGREAFSGDGALATQATLDGPGGLALSPAGLPTFSDRENARIRQVDAAGIIHTVVGRDAIVVAAAGLTLSGPANSVYGTGSLTATLTGSPAAGSITLLERGMAIDSVPLAGNAATFSLVALAAGTHDLTAAFAGDSVHPAAASAVFRVLITPAPLLATPAPATIVYGLAIPTLSGTLTGLLPQDATRVQTSWTSAAITLSPAGSYPVAASITGPAAANYTLTTSAAQLTITRASVQIALDPSLLAQVTPSTAGIPGGSVTLLDGGTPYASLTVMPSGQVQFSAAGLSSGSHTLAASYGGDGNFLPALSLPVPLTIGPASAADFTLAAAQSSVTVSAGSSAVFAFTATPVNGALASPIMLSVSGLPLGATAVFSPAYLPPGSTPTPFTLTIQTIKSASLQWGGGIVAAFALGLFLLPRRRRASAFSFLMMVSLLGCGDRINTAGQGGSTARVYNITVNANATGTTGGTLLHSITVVLTTQ